MTTQTMTRDEASQALQAAVERRHQASDNTDSLARVIAMNDVQLVAIGRTYRYADVSGDLLIVARAAEHEAWADWQDARETCGFERIVR